MNLVTKQILVMGVIGGNRRRRKTLCFVFLLPGQIFRQDLKFAGSSWLNQSVTITLANYKTPKTFFFWSLFAWVKNIFFILICYFIIKLINNSFIIIIKTLVFYPTTCHLIIFKSLAIFLRNYSQIVTVGVISELGPSRQLLIFVASSYTPAFSRSWIWKQNPVESCSGPFVLSYPWRWRGVLIHLICIIINRYILALSNLRVYISTQFIELISQLATTSNID